MRSWLIASCLVVSVAAAASCEDAASEAEDTTSTGTGAGSGVTTGSGIVTEPEGLPCEVAEVLAANCTNCHSNPPRSAAPMPLLTRDDLLAPSDVDPNVTVAARSVFRMREGTMPENGGAEAEADVIDAWLLAGAPEGGCGTGEGGAPPDPFAGPSVCESGKTWTSPVEGEAMNPGQACNDCHAEERAQGEHAPILVVGGTVYPNGHAPDDCYGVNGSAAPWTALQVWITDASSQVYKLDVGPTGNFSLEHAAGFTYPYEAKVVNTLTGAERPMVETPEHGDCNLCHTENGFGDGSDAPGRIVAPD